GNFDKPRYRIGHDRKCQEGDCDLREGDSSTAGLLLGPFQSRQHAAIVASTRGSGGELRHRLAPAARLCGCPCEHGVVAAGAAALWRSRFKLRSGTVAPTSTRDCDLQSCRSAPRTTSPARSDL